MKTIRRLYALVLILVSLTTFLLSIIALLALPFLNRSLQQRADTFYEVSLSTLQTTDQTLFLVADALSQASLAVSAVGATSEDISQTLAGTDPLIQSLSAVTGDDLPAIINSTQDSLTAAEAGAGAVEGVLYRLNTVSILTGVFYNPEKTLEESVAEISTSLDGLPQTFRDVQDDLDVLQANLSFVESGLSDFGASLSEIESSLAQAQAVISEYDQLLGELESNLLESQKTTTRWIAIGTWIAAIFLIWLIVAQIAFLQRGWELLTANGQPTQPAPPEQEEEQDLLEEEKEEKEYEEN